MISVWMHSSYLSDANSVTYTVSTVRYTDVRIVKTTLGLLRSNLQPLLTHIAIVHTAIVHILQ